MLRDALYASFTDPAEKRATDRRVLRLETQADTPTGQGTIKIHNLSRTGMLGEASSGMPAGTGIEVELPGGVRRSAEVVWNDAGLFGCRFAKPISQATLSAALLRAAPLAPPATEAAPGPNSPALDKLHERWKSEDEIAAAAAKSHLPLGTRLWIIVGLGLASWAVPTAIVAWIFWQPA